MGDLRRSCADFNRSVSGWIAAMNLRGALIAAILLGIGGLGLVAWIGLQLPPKPAAAAQAVSAPAMATILTAAHAVRAGALLKYDDIEAREIEAAQVPAGAHPDNARARAELVGSMIRRGLLPHEPLLATDLLRPGDHGFLATVLSPGMRATTVGVDAVSGTAGLIWPGDHVDVILTQISDDQSLPAGRRASAQTVLRDVRVIAIDQELMQGTASPAGPDAAQHTVTLEVTDLQAERVVLAARLGHLSFVVRSADVAPGARDTPPPTTWGGDVSSALTEGHVVGRVMRLYQGNSDVKEFKF
jgi:pilus assembly protein CpaB